MGRRQYRRANQRQVGPYPRCTTRQVWCTDLTALDLAEWCRSDHQKWQRGPPLAGSGYFRLELDGGGNGASQRSHEARRTALLHVQQLWQLCSLTGVQTIRHALQSSRTSEMRTVVLGQPSAA